MASKTLSSGKKVLIGSKADPSSKNYKPKSSLSSPSKSSYSSSGLTSQQIASGVRIERTRDSKGNASYGAPGIPDDTKTSALTAPQAPIDNINTGQPSPSTVKAGVGLPGSDVVNFDTQTGKPLAQGASTTDALGNTFTQGSKYTEALAKLQAGGAAPQDAGVGKMVAGAALQQPPVQPVSPLGGIMETDTNFDSIFTNLDKYMEPMQQKKSLLQEYQSMSKALGIEDINEELIDAKRIIEGTEDDIRAEVTAAGGFATDSQVLAMSNARNKSLIKNYNVLLESRDNAMQQLDTMMNLTIEDRRAAEAEFDRKMNFAFKIADFQQKAKDNAMNQFNKVVENVGYAGLLAATNGNAYEQSIIEKTLGLGAGGLQKLATLPPTEEEKLDILIKRATLANINSQINDRNNEIPEDLSSYVFAYQNGQIPLTQVPQKIRGQVLSQVQASGYNKMLDLLGQYKQGITGLNFLTAQSPTNKAKLGSLKGQITAEYKQQKQLGTLDAGVQTLIDSIIPDPSKLSFSALSNKAQVSALDNFIKNQGGGALPAPDGSGDVIIIKD